MGEYMGLGVQPLNPQHLVTSHIQAVMDISSKEEFIYFMQRACEDQSNQCCSSSSQEVRFRLVAGKPIGPVQGDRREWRRSRFFRRVAQLCLQELPEPDPASCI